MPPGLPRMDDLEARRRRLGDLARKMAALGAGAALGGPLESRRAVATGWAEVDQGLCGSVRSRPWSNRGDPGSGSLDRESKRGGLARGVVHEWLGVEEDPDGAASAHRKRRSWAPPCLLLVHLARRALEDDLADGRPRNWVLWIGRRIWPYPRVLIAGKPLRGLQLLERSLFVDPPDETTRFWAIEAALRTSSLAAVVADGSGLALPASRRLQMAAAVGNSLVLLARPPAERALLSAAATRWRVHRRARAPGEEESGVRPRWLVELLRSRLAGGEAMAFLTTSFRHASRRGVELEWDHESGALVGAPLLLNRSASQAVGA